MSFPKILLSFVAIVLGIFIYASPSSGMAVKWERTSGGDEVIESDGAVRDPDAMLHRLDKPFSGAATDAGGGASASPPAEMIIKWEKTLGGSGFDTGYSVKQTADGGYLIIGSTLSLNSGNMDIYLVKTDVEGTREWERAIGGPGEENGYDIQLDIDGYIIIGDTSINGNLDTYLLKTDFDGDVVWEKIFGGSGDDYGRSVEVTADGGYIAAGVTQTGSAGGYDIYLLKVDHDGNKLWEKTFGGSNDEFGAYVRQTTDGGFIIIGSTDSSGSGASDVYLIKTDSNGQGVWERTFGGSSDDMGFDVRETVDAGYILTGGTMLYGQGYGNIYLIKVDQNGNQLWSGVFGSSYSDLGYAIQLTAEGGYLVAGVTSLETDSDVALLKINSSGQMEWSIVTGGTGSDKAFDVCQTADGGFVIVGRTNSFELGSTDVYLLKLGPVELTDADAVALDQQALEIGFAAGDQFDSVTQDLQLLNNGTNGSSITWSSSNEAVVTADGMVTRPEDYLSLTVILTATITKGDASATKTFKLTVIGTDSQIVAADKLALVIGFALGDSADSVIHDLQLPTSGVNGSNITWSSSNEAVLTTDGRITRPGVSLLLVLTATIIKGDASDARTFNLTIIGTDSQAVAIDQLALVIGFAAGDNADHVTQDLQLPTSGANGASITWSSSNEAVVTTDGRVTLPENNLTIALTATITKGSASASRTFNLTIIGTNTQAVAADQQSLAIGFAAGDNTNNVTQDLQLPTSGANGSSITWTSSDEAVVTSDGMITRSDGGNLAVTMTAIITKGNASATKSFYLVVIISTNAQYVAADQLALEIGLASGDLAHAVTEDVYLATSGANGSNISWTSSKEAVVTTGGRVTRQAEHITVTLTATITKGSISASRVFVLTVLGLLPDEGGQVEWQKFFGGTGTEEGYSVQQTRDGGFIIAGSVPSSSGNVNLIKTDDSGNIQWQQQFGGSNSDTASWASQTQDGGYIVVGRTYSFGAGREDVYLIKTDADGRREWESTFGGIYYDIGMSVEQTADGGYIIGGATDSFGNGDMDVYLTKIDANGTQVWEKAFGGEARDYGYSAHQTNDGGYIVVGETYSFGSGATDVYLIKVDANGSKQWERFFGSADQEYGYSVRQTADGGYIIGGTTLIDGAFNTDVLLIKTDTEGNLEWQRTFGGNKPDSGRSVWQTVDGGYFIVGATNSFGSGWNDVYVVKTDNHGSLQWQNSFGGSDWDEGFAGQQTNDGGYIVVGGTFSFGHGSKDIYLIKLKGDRWQSMLRLDINSNGRIEIDDLASLSQSYGTTDSAKDLNGDNVIDIYDLIIMAKRLYAVN